MPVLSPEQELFAETVRRVAEERIAPIGARMEEDDRFPHDLVDLYRELGWLSLMTPARYGGAEAGSTEWVILAENIARVSAAAAQMFENFGPAIPLRFLGSPEQQDRLFPLLDNRIGCFAATEPEAGSDLGGVRTHAVDKGGSYLINGEKCFITNGGVANFYALVATVEPGSGWSGLRLFMVDGVESPGVSVIREEQKMGLRGSSLAALSFENVEVPADNMIGGETGLRAAQQLLDFARPNVAGMACGLARGAMDYALRYTLERRAFGRPVYEFQGVSFPIADMAIRIEAGRELAYKAAAEVDAGGPRASELASMAKVFCTDTAMAVTTDAVQCLGGHGYLKAHPVERMMRDAKVMQIYIGTNQIQRMLVAEALARRVRAGR
ncbi:MAG TPA: acyl-CoA dehydrogenase family protein [Acidimicrobiia bacterium]|nr:acyl-CoA dehydrogenase family protein [Acidimicrobiia bacterium]